MGRKKKHPGRLPGRIDLRNVEKQVQQALYLQQTGYLSQAEAIYKNVLQSFPGQPDCLHFLGMLYLQAGNSDLAVQYVEKSLQGNTTNAVYHNNYGLVLSRQNKPDAAIREYRRAIELQPDYADAWYNLALACTSKGDLQQAEAAYKEAVRFRPGYIKALYNLASVQELQSRYDDASKTIEQILKLSPDSAEAHNILGAALTKIGGVKNLKRAEYHFWEALKFRPDYLEAYNNLGALLEETNNLEGAIKCYSRVVEIEPQHTEAILNLAHVLIKDEQVSRAEGLLSEILKKNPKEYRALVGMGHIRRTVGDFAGAEEFYISARDINPAEPAIYVGLSGCKKITADDIELINTLKDHSNLDATVNYALGKVFNDIGDYDKAFSYYHRANEIRNNRIDYDVGENALITDRIISFFTGDVIRKMQAGGNNTELPVFVLGTPRSGTTLTEQIISSHPDVHGAGELRFISRQINKLKKSAEETRGYPECISNLTQADIHSLAGEYIQKVTALCPDKPVKRITDKMPANFLYIGYILGLFPNAKIIHCRRHPLDACLSIYFQSFSSGHRYSFDLVKLGYWYRDYLRLMEHWNSVTGDHIYNLDYNDTVNDTEAAAKNIIRFCGLEWNEQCLQFYKTERTVNTASKWQVRQPIYKSSLERWKRYDKYIGPLKEILAGYY